MANNEVRTETVTLKVADGTEMPAYVARPETPNGAGLIVLQEAFGVNSHIRNLTERFASVGYTSIAPALFHRTDAHFEGSYTDFGPVMQHMQALTTEGLTADVTSTFEWLTSGAGGVQAVATTGYCLGGRVSFLAAATVPVKAAISYYGGGIAPNERSAGLLDRTASVNAPLLLFWGGLDGHIGPDQYHAVEEALKEAGKDYIQVVISKADHGFFCDERASYNPAASRQAWALTLEFLSTHLGV